MRLHEVTALLDSWYDPAWADSWDAVGLVAGDPDAEVRRVLLAVDPAPAVVDEALEWGADLVVVHHPLFLRGVSSVAATTPKGRTLHRLLTGGTALFTAHTNADAPAYGVNEALAHAIGIVDPEVIDPDDRPALDKLVVFAPRDAADAVRTALAEAGAGALGDYEACSWSAEGRGRFRPQEGADPAIGSIGELEVVEEERIEVVLERELRRDVLAAMHAAHPYEEVAFDLIELANPGTRRPTRGTGRIGDLATPVRLEELARQVAAALPACAHGVRVGGDPDRLVRRVAVTSGAGDFLLERVLETDADVYLTSDLRHHRAAEFLEHGGPALIDVAHWAAEWTWLPVLEQRLTATVGDALEIRVSTTPTDPWTFRA